MNSEQEVDLITVDEAAVILGLKRSQARAILGEPHTVWRSAAGRSQYVYLKTEVELIERKREAIYQKRIAQRGFRSCYYCHQKFEKNHLCDGLCADCQARKIVRNFACRGDCFRHELDVQRLRILSNAINQLETENAH